MKPCLISLAIAIALLLLPAAGCKKENSMTGKTHTELLTEGNWKFSRARAGGINVSGFLEECRKDNILDFEAGGNGTLDEGATQCSPGDPQTTSFTWNFTNDESVIHVSAELFTGGGSDFDLEELNETELVVSQVVSLDGNSQRVVFTFVH